MDEYDLPRLPVHGQSPDGGKSEDEASCSPTVYVSNEESALLKAMAELRDRAVEIRRLMKTASQDDRRQLEGELEAMRRERQDLPRRRERAFVRKMVMLGHLPPSALDENRNP